MARRSSRFEHFYFQPVFTSCTDFFELKKCYCSFCSGKTWLFGFKSLPAILGELIIAAGLDKPTSKQWLTLCSVTGVLLLSVLQQDFSAPVERGAQLEYHFSPNMGLHHIICLQSHAEFMDIANIVNHENWRRCYQTGSKPKLPFTVRYVQYKACLLVANSKWHFITNHCEQTTSLFEDVKLFLGSWSKKAKCTGFFFLLTKLWSTLQEAGAPTEPSLWLLWRNHSLQKRQNKTPSISCISRTLTSGDS